MYLTEISCIIKITNCLVNMGKSMIFSRASVLLRAQNYRVRRGFHDNLERFFRAQKKSLKKKLICSYCTTMVTLVADCTAVDSADQCHFGNGRIGDSPEYCN